MFLLTFQNFSVKFLTCINVIADNVLSCGLSNDFG